jgi:hypothetical protein
MVNQAWSIFCISLHCFVDRKQILMLHLCDSDILSMANLHGLSELIVIDAVVLVVVLTDPWFNIRLIYTRMATTGIHANTTKPLAIINISIIDRPKNLVLDLKI